VGGLGENADRNRRQRKDQNENRKAHDRLHRSR
jgi:hypothetical protein